MIFTATPLAGAFVMEPEPIADNRGFFARLYCADDFVRRNLNPHLHQISMSHNNRAGVVRGLHLQRPPHAEVKLVRVTQGAIYDVVVDLRAGSATYGTWFAVELNALNRKLLYVPEGLAHGFQTLTETADVTYHISAPYVPALQDGVRWNDPDLAISWPYPERAVVSDRDTNLPFLAGFEPIAVAV